MWDIIKEIVVGVLRLYTSIFVAYPFPAAVFTLLFILIFFIWKRLNKHFDIEPDMLWKKPWFILLTGWMIITPIVGRFISSRPSGKPPSISVEVEKVKGSKVDIHVGDVTSYNQSGGITAYNVNIGQQDRKLTQQLADQLTKYIIENDVNNITITSVMGDQEAFQFASVIKAFLVDQGYSVNGVNQAVYLKPVRGQIIEPGEDPKSINIIIGGRLPEN